MYQTKRATLLLYIGKCVGTQKMHFTEKTYEFCITRCRRKSRKNTPGT